MGLFSKPEVVIYKETSNAKEDLKQLEELYERAEGEVKEKIGQEINIVRAGIIGEDQILYELKNSGMDMYVLHDIYLECRESDQLPMSKVQMEKAAKMMMDRNVERRTNYLEKYKSLIEGAIRKSGYRPCFVQDVEMN